MRVWFNRTFSSVYAAIDLIRELASIDGVGGVHIMAPLNEKAVPKLLEEARSALAKG